MKVRKEDMVRLSANLESPLVRKLAEHLRSRVKGQDRAIRYLIERCELVFADLNDQRRPLVTVLEVGPSGVGKTLLVEAFAEFLFGSPDSMTKIACSDYQERHHLDNLLGSPPGYVNSWDPDQPDPRYRGTEPLLSQYNIDKHDFLQRSQNDPEFAKNEEKLGKIIEELFQVEMEMTDLENKEKHKTKEYETLRKKFINLQRKGRILQKKTSYNPKNDYVSVILFDEVEKANDALHKVMLEIMDKGRVALRNGKTVTRFNNSFIFMTANVGSDKIADLLENRRIGLHQQKPIADEKELDQNIYDVCMEEVKREFPPEFVGRVDQVVVFRPLSDKMFNDIVDVQIQEFHTQLFKGKSSFPLVLNLSDKAKEFLVKKTFKYSSTGARRLKKVIEKYIKTPLAKNINSFRCVPGDIIYIDLEVDDKGKERLRLYRLKRKEEGGSDQPILDIEVDE